MGGDRGGERKIRTGADIRGVECAIDYPSLVPLRWHYEVEKKGLL